MAGVDDILGAWLVKEMDSRGWSVRELSRRAGTSHTTISQVIAGQRRPTYKFCIQIARALHVPDDDLLVLAGLKRQPLQPLEDEQEMIAILRALPAQMRQTIVTMLRALAGSLTGQPPTLATDQDDVLNRELLSEFERVPDEWKQEVINQARMLSRLAEHPPARFIGDDSLEDQGEQREPAEVGSV